MRTAITSAYLHHFGLESRQNIHRWRKGKEIDKTLDKTDPWCKTSFGDHCSTVFYSECAPCGSPSSTCGGQVSAAGTRVRLAPLRSLEQQEIRAGRLHTSSHTPPPPSPLSEQPAASGQQPPNCWGAGVLPYLIALDDVIDLPQVAAATCFVADLQQHQAYFLLSQFSRRDSALSSPLAFSARERQTWLEGGKGKEGKNCSGARWSRKRERVSFYPFPSGRGSVFHFWGEFGMKFGICLTRGNSLKHESGV